MKILYASYIRFPSERAHAIQVANMNNAFVECGHETTLLTTSRRKAVTHTFEEYFGVKQLFIHRTVWIPEWAVNASLFTKLWQIYFGLACTFYVWRNLPNLVYSRDEWTLYVLSFLIPKQLLVWESHEGKWNQAAKRLLRRGVRCVVISEGISDLYVDRGVKQTQLLVAHDAIDLRFLSVTAEKPEARRYLNIKGEEKVVMYIGGLDTWKGVDVLCQAAKLFKSKAKLYIIGGRDKQLEDYKRHYPEVSFLGFRPYSELPLIQQAADVLVIPNTAKNNLSSKFTSPLKLFTYLASGVPIVASDVPSLRNVLGEGKCFYFKADDLHSLSDTVIKVLDQPEKGITMAKEARKLVEDKIWVNRAHFILKSVMVK